MIQSNAFIEPIRQAGYTQYAGVPCSFLTPFINYVIDDARLDYVGATSEGEAVAINLGAYLAGRKTVTMCQNSGLGNTVNPLTSLNYPFRIPTLLITTWRGEPGIKDEPQHEQMGRITQSLLDTLEIPWRAFPADGSAIAPIIEEADRYMHEKQRPFALVMSKDTVGPHELKNRLRGEIQLTEQLDLIGLEMAERLTRTGALEIILQELAGDEALIATTGKTGRELFTIQDDPNNLYVVGGMGTASAIGFGIAHALPEQPVVVIDGDGAALLKMGNFATIGFYQPANLLHIILDNEVHDSTGGQSTVSSIARFTAIAAATNYRHAHAVDSVQDLRASLHFLRARRGPSLLHVKIRKGSPPALGRPTVKPHEVKERFMDFIASRQSVKSTGEHVQAYSQVAEVA